MKLHKKPRYILCNCHTVTDSPKKSLLKKILYVNSCKSNIIFFKIRCLTCMSLSTKQGEISHEPNCIFEQCIHSDKYCGIAPWWEQQVITGLVGSQILSTKYKKNNISYSRDRLIHEDIIPGVLNMNTKWSSHQPNINIRQIHMIFRKSLFEKIKEQLTIMDKNRMNLVYKIVEIKTNKKLY